MSGIPKSKILYVIKSKEDILGFLVTKFLDGVSVASDAVSKTLTDNKLFILMASDVLQIYMAEMNEDMRNLYLSAYSMSKTSEEVLKRRTEMVYDEFGDMFPSFAVKDFYELEIASIGIMRSYMTVSCDMYFTIEAKVERLITTMLRIYDVDKKIIEDTIIFMKKSDKFTGVAEIFKSNVWGNRLDITLYNLWVESGNFRVVLVHNDEIVHEFTNNEQIQSYTLEKPSGTVALRIAGESADFTFSYDLV